MRLNEIRTNNSSVIEFISKGYLKKKKKRNMGKTKLVNQILNDYRRKKTNQDIRSTTFASFDSIGLTNNKEVANLRRNNISCNNRSGNEGNLS